MPPAPPPAEPLPPVPPRRARVRVLWAAALLALAATTFAVLGVRALLPDTGGSSDGSYTLDRDGYRYVFHAVTGDEGLFDVSRDPRLLRNLIGEDRDRADRMRRALERREGVESLDALRDRENDTILSLRALGYL